MPRMPSAPELPPNLWPLLLRLGFGTESPALDSEGERDRLIKLATSEGLFPLLLADPEVPPQIARLRPSMRALGALMNARYALQLEAAKKFTALVPDALFIKGFDYRHRLYASPSWRPSHDLDAFVPRPSVKASMQRLHAAGYPQVHSYHGISWAAGDYYEVSYDIGEVRVELHRSIGHRVRASVDYDELWSRRESFEAGGATFFRPSTVDAIVLHALTLAKDEMAATLVRYVDFWTMLQRWPELLPNAVDVARRWSLERALYASLRVTTAMFPDVTSDAITRAQDALLTRRVRAFLDRRVIPDRTAKLSGHVDGRATQLWRKFWLTDRVWRRFAFVGYSAYAIATAAAREAMHPDAVDEYVASKRRPEAT